MIGFLKKKQEAMLAGGSQKQDGGEYGMLDAVSEDILEAVAQKDKKLLREALEAMCDYLREEDVEQDQELEA